MPNLYIIAGCNGAGKTTASYIMLPRIFDCREFVNADNIAAELSPSNVESVAFEAGRLMLNRVNQLIEEKASFAFETTLATRSYVSLIKKAQSKGYKITLLFFWLRSPELAKIRVADRVSEGGHSIPPDIIERRYYRGIYNLINLYMPICDNWIIVNNVNTLPESVAEGGSDIDILIINMDIWSTISKQANTVANKSINTGELSAKVLQGMAMVMKELIETKAANNKSLVISDNDGKIKIIPAKDLLDTLPK